MKLVCSWKCFVLLLCTFATGVVAEPRTYLEKKYSRLFSQPLRPSIDLFLTTFNNDFSRPSPFGKNRGFSDYDVKQDFTAEGPKIIAQIQQAYPGAWVATLGRDADLIGDFLEAFYKHHGINHNVIRIRASRDTVDESERSEFLQYLKQLGLNYSNPSKVDNSPPLVIIDHTPYDSNSQSRIILSMLYEEYVANGGNPKDLLRKLNVISSDFSPYLKKGKAEGYWIGMIRLSDYFEEQKEYLQRLFDRRKLNAEQNQIPFNNRFTPRNCLQFDIQTALTDTASWNKSYGKIVASPSEKYFTSVSGASQNEERENVLDDIYNVIKVAKSPEILDETKMLLRDYSLFTKTAPHFLTKITFPLDQEIEFIRQSIHSFEPVNFFNFSSELSSNAQKLDEWYQNLLNFTAENSEQTFKLQLRFISLIDLALKTKKIAPTDFSELFYYILNGNYLKEELPLLLKFLRSTLSRSTVKQLLESAQDIDNNDLKLTIKTTKALIRLSKKLPESCEDTFNL